MHSFAFITSLLSLTLLFFSLFPTSAHAATAEQWRSRSIYQIITDRFALPDPSSPNLLTVPNPNCNPGDQTWCGGTWQSIISNLDYIQGMGFTAIWISPVSENYDGPRTPYGDAYHGYWSQNVTALNPRMGTPDDLKALSNALHARGMYLMVDIVANNVITLNYTDPDLSKFAFTSTDMYHPYCPIDFSNQTSIEHCWLGDTVVALMDVNTENQDVINIYNTWIASLVQEYQIDGLRIDAAKHVRKDFWPGFCSAAGVFCMGEVFGGDVPYNAGYQGPGALASVLDYPIYDYLVSAFTIPGPGNISGLVDGLHQGQELYQDMSVLGTFLENQDNPRWANLSVDPQSLWNAMVWQFLAGGIPIVYYGQEQGLRGNADPYNREPLWPTGYANTTTYQITATLNQLRNFLIANAPDFLTSNVTVLGTSSNEVAIARGPLVAVMTNRGSPPVNATMGIFNTGFMAGQPLTEILYCKQVTSGSEGTLLVDYSSGGHASIFMRTNDLRGSGLCGQYTDVNPDMNGLSAASAARAVRVRLGGWVMMAGLILAGLVFLS
ncbi:glycoside hydrolase family 13 protein [Dacryopinax primogenitus]|uniref:alpha-amylase n=1 Tax=Dacryopinax primogenitus (strain DJM 731) TaxID=1858805 RepID=M5GB20_DACPD|nr:glycoside hydrolase family 13 protein [Dacryopinax primogenitus]EJU01148.1 glycoside hydrolase family 13 protein [Dacryopinax primogenitus]